MLWTETTVCLTQTLTKFDSSPILAGEITKTSSYRTLSRKQLLVRDGLEKVKNKRKEKGKKERDQT